MNAQSSIRFPWKPVLLLLILHAGLVCFGLCGVMLLGHLQCHDNARPTKVSHLQSPPMAKFEDGRQFDPSLLPVNERARSEVKQQQPSNSVKEGRWIYNPNTGEHVWCPNCPPVVITPAPQPAPVLRPSPTPAPAIAPAVVRPTDQPAKAPTQQQIMLFLIPGDPLSEKLEHWFDSNPTLVRWRATGTFHKFTPDNKLYQTLTNRGVRLRDQMPVSVFPAALFTAPDGGHIHAAIKQFIPDTPEQLIEDVGKGKQNWKQMRESIPGTVPMSQYSFDDAINPKSRLDNQDCVGPDCPIRPSDSRRPGARIVDLFPNAKDKAEGVVKDAVWGWLDIIVTGVVALCVVAAGLVALLVFALVVAYIVRSRRLNP